ncbi:MAG: hypothetical protein JWM77_1360 [Rhodospirillales bacterium]|nr:hypothetical protein [Rhodospirillales bacterium]
MPLADPTLFADWLRLLSGGTMMAWAAACFFGGARRATKAAAGWSVLCLSGHGMLLLVAATPLCLSATSRPIAIGMLGVHVAAMLAAAGTITLLASRSRSGDGQPAFVVSLLGTALLLFVL